MSDTRHPHETLALQIAADIERTGEAVYVVAPRILHKAGLTGATADRITSRAKAIAFDGAGPESALKESTTDNPFRGPAVQAGYNYYKKYRAQPALSLSAQAKKNAASLEVGRTKYLETVGTIPERIKAGADFRRGYEEAEAEHREHLKESAEPTVQQIIKQCDLITKHWGAACQFRGTQYATRGLPGKILYVFTAGTNNPNDRSMFTAAQVLNGSVENWAHWRQKMQ